jgi:hypothetical protein
MSPPSSVLISMPRNIAFLKLLSFLAYASSLKMEVICSSKMLVDFHWAKWCYIPEDSTPVYILIIQRLHCTAF